MFKKKQSNLWNIVFLNSLISIFQSVVNACLNIMTQIFQQHGFKQLGNLSVLLIFSFGLVGNILCITYVKKFKYNVIFFTHALGYLFLVSEGVLICYCYDGQVERKSIFCSSKLTWILVIICSSITGFMSSGFWISQNEYISESSNLQNVGFYYGVSWGIVQFSQVMGGLYSAYIIEPLGNPLKTQISTLGQLKFFNIMVLIGFCSSLLFFLLRQPNQVKYQKIEDSQEQDKKETATKQNIKSEQWQEELFYQLSVKEQLIQQWEVMTQKKVMLLNFPIMITGVTLSFQYTVMHQLIENSIDMTQREETVNSLTFKVVILLGAMEVIGGIVTGYLNTIYSKTTVIIVINLLLQVALLIGLANFFLKDYSLCYIVAGIWGFVDCGTTNSMLALISEHFGDDVRIFSDFNFFQCFGGMCATLVTIIFESTSIQWLVFIALLFQTIANGLLQIWLRIYTLDEKISSLNFLN